MVCGQIRNPTLWNQASLAHVFDHLRLTEAKCSKRTACMTNQLAHSVISTARLYSSLSLYSMCSSIETRRASKFIFLHRVVVVCHMGT